LGRSVEVVFLGTSGGMPTQERGLPAVIVRDWTGFLVLFDVGEGVQYKMMNFGIPLSKIDVIAITHSHGDHINGLPGLLQTLYMLKRSRPLSIFCDRDASEFIKDVLEVERIPFSFAINIFEISGRGNYTLYKRGGDELTLYWRPSCHSIESYAFKLVWRLRPRIDVEKLKSLGLQPTPEVMQALVRGERLKVGNKVVTLKEVALE